MFQAKYSMNDNIKDSELTDAFSTRLMEQQKTNLGLIYYKSNYLQFTFGVTQNNHSTSFSVSERWSNDSIDKSNTPRKSELGGTHTTEPNQTPAESYRVTTAFLLQPEYSVKQDSLEKTEFIFHSS